MMRNMAGMMKKVQDMQARLCLGRFGVDAKGWVGPGMGVDDDSIAYKAAIIEKAAAFQHPVDDHAVALLVAFGGYE